MKKIKTLFLCILIGLLLIIGIVWIVDPLYQYHGPLFGMNPVLFDSNLQVPGTIRTFDYDSVFIGSSMAENADTTVLDENNNSKTLKVIKQSGDIPDFLYYLQQIHKYKKIKTVYLNIDLFAFDTGTMTDLPSEYTPEYLFTKSMLDDYPYIFNKDILLEKIPLFLAYEKSGKYSPNKAYDFSEGKIFDAQAAKSNYERLEEILPETDYSDSINIIEANILSLIEEMNSHSEIRYILFYSPYSELWWDNAHREGNVEKYFYILERTLDEFSKVDNAEVYFFLNEKEIVCDLDNYMDTMHFKPEINQYILESFEATDEHRIINSQVESTVEKTRQLFEYIILEDILKYFNE